MCSSFFYTIVRDNTGQAQTARFVTPALPQCEPLPRRTKMAKGFTDLKIKNLKAGAVRREIPDPGASGLYLVVQPSGKSLSPFAIATTARRASSRCPVVSH